MRRQPQLRNYKYITVSLHLAYCCTATFHCSTYSYLRNLVSRSLKRWFLICETLQYQKLCLLDIRFNLIRSLQYLPLLAPFYALKNPHHYISAGVFIVKNNSSYHSDLSLSFTVKAYIVRVFFDSTQSLRVK